VDKEPKGPRQKPPQGLFSGGGATPSVDDYDPHTAATPVPGVGGAGRMPETPTYRPPGAHVAVLEDLEEARNSVDVDDRQRSSFPPPLGQAEGHDAWTVEHMHRQSTVPPVRHDDVDRLRELAALHLPPNNVPSSELMGNALDLVDRSRPSQQLDLVGEMEDLYALDDLTGALRYAELILGREPDNGQARRCAENCRERLVLLYSSKIGTLDGVPMPSLNETELRWLGLDHRSGFLLSRVDGFSTVEEILDVCGMPRLEALKTLVDLLDRGAIRIARE